MLHMYWYMEILYMNIIKDYLLVFQQFTADIFIISKFQTGIDFICSMQ